MSESRSSAPIACVDFGSTFTKAALVERGSGRLLATAEHPTTLDGDVLDGWYACRAELVAADPRADEAQVLACSSAGGGLRIAVVGNEELVTAEAGRRVALSSGGRVVAVLATAATAGLTDLTRLHACDPDVVLLVGGTDGGEEESILTSARTLADGRWDRPVVVAGNREAAPRVATLLGDAGVPHVVADNVVPRIGVLAPDSARAAVREVFLRHVIGGKQLSADPAFAALVRGATPDVVLSGVELLADLVGEAVVVDVGGATTDVHSWLEPDPEARAVVAQAPAQRTVEGDLGMRWSAPSTVEADPDASGSLRSAAERRRADPAYVPTTEADRSDDERIATVAARVALRRHAGRVQVVYDERGRVVERSGRDLREVDLLVGSGGVLRHASPEAAARILGGTGSGDGWQLPEHPRVVVDVRYVLAAAGLLAVEDRPTAVELLRSTLLGAGTLTQWPRALGID